MDITPGQVLPGFYDSVNKKFSIDNPMILVVLVVIIILYYVVFKYLGSAGVDVPSMPMRENKGIRIIEIIMWALFIFLILVNGLQYFFSLDIKTTIKNIFSKDPEVDIKVIDVKTTKPAPIPPPPPPPVPEIMIEKQVFNIPANKYTYNDAQAVCEAYNANLATYDQIEKAYKKGAEWCGFGWSDKQMIFYPTQKDTFNKLQDIPGHRHDCGRPGINGGFIGNKNALFGVNCYGYKPEMTPEESETLGNSPAYPLTKNEMAFNDKVARFRTGLPDILLSPFNNNKWSQI